MVELIVLVIALLAGLLARVAHLPPMLGFLLAGFALTPLQRFLPELAGLNVQPLADVGITLLLFSIGLKLDIRSLLRPFVWAVTCLHMSVVMLLMWSMMLVGWLPPMPRRQRSLPLSEQSHST